MAKEEIVGQRKTLVKLIKCGCEHAFQDKRYGLCKRVHNPMATPGNFRCTVCGRVNT